MRLLFMPLRFEPQFLFSCCFFLGGEGYFCCALVVHVTLLLKVVLCFCFLSGDTCGVRLLFVPLSFKQDFPFCSFFSGGGYSWCRLFISLRFDRQLLLCIYIFSWNWVVLVCACCSCHFAFESSFCSCFFPGDTLVSLVVHVTSLSTALCVLFYFSG